MCFTKNGKEKKLDYEFAYIVSALHIDEEQLSASSVDKLTKNIYAQLKPFLPDIEQDLVLLEEYLMFSIKQQAVWGAYMRARKRMTDIFLGTREIVFLGERGFEELDKYCHNIMEDIKNGQKVEGIYWGEKLYGRNILYHEEPLPDTQLAKQSKKKLEIKISSFRNRLKELKENDCYSRVFLGINTVEKHYCFPMYNADLIKTLLSPLNAFERKLLELRKIKNFDMSEKKQKTILACYRAHQKLARFFKTPKINSSSATIRDALAFNHELEAFYHVEYLQKAMQHRKINRTGDYIFETMLDNTLIANAELPNPFFRDVIVRKEIEYSQTNFYKKKDEGGKKSLVTFYEEENLLLSELESILFWAKRTTELPQIMNKLIYPAAEILLCHALAENNGYENALTILKKYLNDNEVLLGRGIESFMFLEMGHPFKNQTTDKIKEKKSEKETVEMFFVQSFDKECHEEEYRAKFLSHSDDIKETDFLSQYIKIIQDAKEVSDKTTTIKSSDLSESDFVFLYHFFQKLFTAEKAQERKEASLSSNLRNAGRKNMDISGKTNNDQEHYRNRLASAMKELILAP